MDASSLESLVKWANTFEGLSKPIRQITDLADGVVLSEILAEIAPNHFDVENIKKDVEDNWILKSNNIKKIVGSLDKFYQVELGIHESVNIDATSLAKEQNVAEIVKLVELILGVLVESERKTEYLQKIMTLDEDTQRALMVILEGIINRHQLEMSTDHSFHDSSSSNFVDARITEMQQIIDQLSRELMEDKEQLSDLKQDHQLSLDQVKMLKDEREALQKTVYSLEDSLEEEKKRAKEKEREHHDNNSHHHSLKSAFEDERGVLFAAEIEEKDRIIADLKKRVDELGKQAHEARSLRDELDILRESAQKVPGLEEKLKKAQQKAEQVNDLKKHLKSVEEASALNLQRALEAEENAKNATSYKTQLESYKNQWLQLKSEHTQLELSLRSLRTESEQAKAAFNKAELENQALKFRVDTLQSEVDDLTLAANASSSGTPLDMTGTAMHEEGLVPQSAERIARLERENRTLKEGLNPEAERRITELTNQLEDAQKLHDMLKGELEKSGGGGTSAVSLSEINALKEQITKQTAEIHVLKEQTAAQMAEINNLLKEKQEYIQYKSSYEALTEKMKSAAEKIASLSSDKTKLEGLMRAAKSIIQEQKEQLKQRALQQQQTQNIELLKKEMEDAVQSYKTRLEEKDKEIQMIKHMWEEGKENSAKEQRLMTSAFYDMGVELNRLRYAKSSSTSSSSSPSTSNTTPPPATPRSLLATLRRGME